MKKNTTGKKQIKKGLYIAFRILILFVISAVIGVSLYTFNTKKVTGDPMPMPFGYGVSIVASGSMEPELSVNDLVVIKAADTVAVGDIVVYETSTGSLVIHKVISLDGDTVTTQGTANNTPDSPVELSAVKGKLLFSIPRLGAVITALKTPAGIIFLLAAAVILFEAPYFIKKKNDSKDIEKLKEEIKKLKDEEE